MSRPLAFILVLALAALLTTRVAQAGESARLVYSRSIEAASCPDERELRRLVARRLGYDPFVAASVNTVVAELRGENEGLKARVYVIRDGNVAGGTRELLSPTRNCTDLAATVALAISIAVDPDALDRTEAPETTESDNELQPEPAPDSSVTSAEKPPGVSAPAGQRPSAATTKNGPMPSGARVPRASMSATPEHASVLVGMAPFVATGPGPAPMFGASADVTVRWRNWGFALAPAATLASTSEATASGSQVRVWVATGTASVDRHFGRIHAGALFDLSLLNASGQGVDAPKSSHPLLASAGLRVGLGWRLTESWSLAPRVDALLALTRITMQLDGAQVFKTPIGFVRVGLGAHYRF